MHFWGDKDFSDEQFNQVGDAAEYIGSNLLKWFRIGVRQRKEKYGTVRVYCSLGFSSLYSLWRPHYVWIPKWWPYSLDLNISRYLMPLVNFIALPIQQIGYRYIYKQAVKKWPHLKNEILCCADFSEYLKGL